MAKLREGERRVIVASSARVTASWAHLKEVHRKKMEEIEASVAESAAILAAFEVRAAKSAAILAAYEACRMATEESRTELVEAHRNARRARLDLMADRARRADERRAAMKGLNAVAGRAFEKSLEVYADDGTRSKKRREARDEYHRSTRPARKEALRANPVYVAYRKSRVALEHARAQYERVKILQNRQPL